MNTTPYATSSLITSGKTKRIFVCRDDNSLGIVQSQDDITAFDDPSYTRRFGTKAKCATATTCRVFELLGAAGIPVAYGQQLSDTEFLVPLVQMIGLEVVARRYAPPESSYTKRRPDLRGVEGSLPYRFHRLCIEFFLKTTETKAVANDGEHIQLNLDPDPKQGQEDPFIFNPLDSLWKLYHPKKPLWDQKEPLDSIDRSRILPAGKSATESIAIMDELTRKVFLVLEGAWNTLGLRFIDLKIEFGLLPDGTIVVADVIDNDSWRLRTFDWQDLSKQSFRDGQSLSEVEKKYGIVADLVGHFRVPHQALVVWKASDSDPDFAVPEVPGVDVVTVSGLSGHKATSKALAKLSELATIYPDGGVIITTVGRSNGLGPVLAAHSVQFQVVSVPASYADFPDDVHSNIRMPSLVPHPVVWPVANAVLLALNILAQKNPVAYMCRQFDVETLDV